MVAPSITTRFKMKFGMQLLAGFLGAALAGAALGQCVGDDIYTVCTDASGNTYEVMQYGNVTEVQGRNRNGERWSQETYDYGTMTETTGRDKDGNRWNATGQRIGDMYIQEGRDSDGNRFSCETYLGETTCR